MDRFITPIKNKTGFDLGTGGDSPMGHLLRRNLFSPQERGRLLQQPSWRNTGKPAFRQVGVYFESEGPLEPTRTSPKSPNRLPHHILDAPVQNNIISDFYSSPIDWKKENLALSIGSEVYSLRLAPDGTRKIKDKATLVFRDDREEFRTVRYSNTGDLAMLGRRYMTVCRRDVSICAFPLLCRNATKQSLSLEWVDENCVAYVQNRHKIELCDIRGGSRAPLRFHTSKVVAMKSKPDGRFLATSDNKNQVAIWDLRMLKHQKPLQTLLHQAAVKAMDWNHSMLLTGGGQADRGIHVWNAQLGQHTAMANTGSQVTSAYWSPCGGEMVTTHGDLMQNRVRRWQFKHGNIVDCGFHSMPRNGRDTAAVMNSEKTHLAVLNARELISIYCNVFQTPKAKASADAVWNRVIR